MEPFPKHPLSHRGRPEEKKLVLLSGFSAAQRIQLSHLPTPNKKLRTLSMHTALHTQPLPVCPGCAMSVASGPPVFMELPASVMLHEHQGVISICLWCPETVRQGPGTEKLVGREEAPHL